MAVNLLRLILNMKKDPNLNRLINSIDKKFSNYGLGANTPLPNQALETASFGNGSPSCLYFSESASKKLQTIRDLAQNKYVYRFKQGKEDKPIDFVCIGYLDHSGDIVITDTYMPGIEIYEEANLDIQEAIYKSSLSKDVGIVTQSECFDYLRRVKLNTKINNSIGIMPVALMGTTRPIIATNDGSEYCPKFSEIAKAIMPANVDIDHPIMSGVLSVSPKYQAQSPNGETTLTNGSLECVLISYKNNKNNTVTPEGFFNVTRCQEILKDQSRHVVDISKSKQPLTDIPILSETKVKK